MQLQNAYRSYCKALHAAKEQSGDLAHAILMEVGKAIECFDGASKFPFGTFHWEYKLIPDHGDAPEHLRIDLRSTYRKNSDGIRRMEHATRSRDELRYAAHLERFLKKTLGLGRECHVHVVVVSDRGNC